jgi:hypothetical protein
VSATYVDAAGLAVWLYNTAVPVLQVLQGAMHVRAAPFGVRLNLQDLPPADVLARHLGAAMTYTAVEPDGLRMGYVSDFGAMGLVVPAAMLAATAAGFARTRAEVEVHRTIAEAEARRAEEEARERAGAARHGRRDIEVEMMEREAARLHRETEMLRQRIAEIERQVAELRHLAGEDPEEDDGRRRGGERGDGED